MQEQETNGLAGVDPVLQHLHCMYASAMASAQPLHTTVLMAYMTTVIWSVRTSLVWRG